MAYTAPEKEECRQVQLLPTNASVDAAEVAVLSELRDGNKKDSPWSFLGGQYASAVLPISSGKSLV